MAKKNLEKRQNKNPDKTGNKKGYEVGYKHPPREHQFKPGVWSGGHRPIGSISLTAMIKRKLQELSPDGKRQALEVLADNIIQDGLDSSDKMRQLIWNYLDGLPKSSTDITTGGEPLKISQLDKDIKYIAIGVIKKLREKE